MCYVAEVTIIEKLMSFCGLQNIKLRIMSGVELYLLVLLNKKQHKLPVSLSGRILMLVAAHSRGYSR
jgi:hypothetical protein